jgi:hypothetical protein
MQIPDDYRKAAHRSAIWNELAKLIMTRLLATENDPLLSPKLFVEDAAVPEAAFQEVLLEVLTLKREADRVIESYELVRTNEKANSLPSPGSPARSSLPRGRAPTRHQSGSRGTG